MSFPNPHSSACFWFDAAEKFGAADNHLCEEVSCGVIAGPANTWSNLAYFFVAMYLWRKDRRFSIFVFFLGGISFFSHASLIYPALITDLALSVTLVVYMNAWRMTKTGRMKEKHFLPYVMGWFIIAAAMFHLILREGNSYAWLIGASAGSVIIAEFFCGSWKKKNFCIALALLAGAFLFTSVDLNEGFCRPSSWFQGHAVWHLLTAISMIFIERHYSDLGTNPQTT